MSDRQKKVILIVIALLIVLGIVLLYWPRAAEPVPVDAVPTNQPTGAPGLSLSQSGTAVNVAPPVQLPPEPSQPPDPETAVQQLAMTFAERYGSFSSESDFVNVEDLYPLMTERYQRATEAALGNLRGEPSAGEGFTSTTTVAIRADVTLPDAAASTTGSAVVLAQRTSVRAGGAPTTTTATLLLEVVQIADGVWRVDRVQWRI